MQLAYASKGKILSRKTEAFGLYLGEKAALLAKGEIHVLFGLLF